MVTVVEPVEFFVTYGSLGEVMHADVLCPLLSLQEMGAWFTLSEASRAVEHKAARACLCATRVI